MVMNQQRQAMGSQENSVPFSALPRGSRWLGPLLIALAGMAMLNLGWLRFVDPVVDFGREAYVPLRLSQGAVLYRDVAYFNGPLSPYLNGGLFALFGSSLRTLFLANGFLLVLLTREIYRTICFLADRLTATCSCIFFVTVFGFGEIIGAGNYNYIGPYSHEMTHGIFLSFAAFSRLRSYVRNARLRHIATAALFLGLALLTKPEIAIALLPALLLFVFLAREDRTRIPPNLLVPNQAHGADEMGQDPAMRGLSKSSGEPVGSSSMFLSARDWFRSPSRALVVGLVLLVSALPPLVAWLLLSTRLPSREAFLGLLGGFRYLHGFGVADLYYYKYGMGLLDPSASLLAMAIVGLVYAAAVAIPAVICLVSKRRRGYRILATGLFLLEGAALLYLQRGPGYLKAALPFPVLLLVTTAICLAAHRRTRSPTVAYLASLALFALLLLVKMVLNTRLYHYGFVLAMPAALFLASLLLYWIPRSLETRHGDPLLFRISAVILLVALAFPCLRQTIRHDERKTHLLCNGANSIRVGERGRLLRRALAYLKWETLPGNTLLVLPEGALVNFLSRRRNPTPYLTFMPPELLMFHDEAMLTAIRRHPPDVVMFIHLDTSVPYRMRFFGRDYAATISSYVKSHYAREVLFGAKPFTGPSFGIEILRRLP